MPPHATPDPNPGARRVGIGSAAVGISAAVLLIAALMVAKPIFAPLTFALLVIAIVWPLQAGLQKRLPKLVALAISMLATIVVLAAFGWTIAWAFSRVGRYIVTDAARFQSLYTDLETWLEAHDIVVASLWAEHFNVGFMLRAFQQVASRVNGALSFSIVVVIYV